MTETTYKFDGTFPATNTQVSLLSRRIHGVTDNHSAGRIVVNKWQSFVQSKKGGLPWRLENNLRAFQPAQIRTVTWEQPSRREEVCISRQADGTWLVRYRGSGSFNGPYYRAFVEAIPTANPCATICIKLMNVVNAEGGKQKERHSKVIEAAAILVNIPSASKALTLLPPLMAASLSLIPNDLLQTGIRMLRRNLTPQPAA